MMPRWYSLSGKVNRWEWLAGLKPIRVDSDILYVHASPRDPMMEYVEDSDFADMGFGTSQRAMDIFEKIERLSFCGHTHRPGVVTQDFHWMKPHILTDMRHHLRAGDKTLVNIGSVGQPRDGNPRSCYVIHDDVEQTITFRRVEYDIPKAQARFKKVPLLSERLWRRLETGS
jgi:diadenosine tetraphosphatase ApaH/serine/threonine PP2A family protein phosphatase